MCQRVMGEWENQLALPPDVYQDAPARHPTLSFAAIYNILELPVEMGEVRRVIVDELRRRST